MVSTAPLFTITFAGAVAFEIRVQLVNTVQSFQVGTVQGSARSDVICDTNAS